MIPKHTKPYTGLKERGDARNADLQTGLTRHAASKAHSAAQKPAQPRVKLPAGKAIGPSLPTGAERVLSEKHFLPAYNFMVEIISGGVSLPELAFTKITGLEASVNTETIPDGGSDDEIRLTFLAAKGERQLTFEMGMAYSKDQRTAEEKLSGFLKTGRRIDKIKIYIMDRGWLKNEKREANAKQKPIRKTYTIQNAIVKKWSLRELDAMSGQIQIQHFEVSYGEMREE